MEFFSTVSWATFDRLKRENRILIDIMYEQDRIIRSFRSGYDQNYITLNKLKDELEKIRLYEN